MGHDHHHHGHGHHAHHHHHGVDRSSDFRLILVALLLICGIMAVEVVVGIMSHSLALLSDAGHMLTDAAALALSLFAIRISERPPSGSMTYGFWRVEILSAQANGITLLVLALLIVFESIRRLVNPPNVDGAQMLVVALLGVAINLIVIAVLMRANRESLNVEGSFQHILTDLFAFVATAIAAAILLVTGYDRADSIASLLVAGLMLRSAYGLLKASGRIFLEAAPVGIEPDAVGQSMAEVDGVVEVHDLHVWELTSHQVLLTAHITVEQETDCHTTRFRIEQHLNTAYGINHTTLQVDHKRPTLITLEKPHE